MQKKKNNPSFPLKILFLNTYLGNLFRIGNFNVEMIAFIYYRKVFKSLSVPGKWSFIGKLQPLTQCIVISSKQAFSNLWISQLLPLQRDLRLEEEILSPSFFVLLSKMCLLPSSKLLYQNWIFFSYFTAISQLSSIWFSIQVLCHLSVISLFFRFSLFFNLC